MSEQTILVVEDDPGIRRGLVDALDFAGYGVLESEDGPTAVQTALESDLDLILLDVMLPGMSGFEVLEQVRKAHPTLPIIMVTARGAEEDRVNGLRIGADDYVIKPFSAKELLARVEAVLRRSPERPTDVQSIRAGDIVIDLARREITMPDSSRHCLSEREAAILRYLSSCRGRAVDRNELLHRVWGLNPRGLHTRTVDMHIARLREKLNDDPADAKIIVTVRGKGYMLADSVQTEPS